MPQRFDDCIFCGQKNGSAEHVVLAALGGLRTHRGILCSPCNNSFSSLDSALAEDMRSLNALTGVRHGRTKDPLRTEIQDRETGRTYVLSEARQVRHGEPLVLEDRMIDGVRNVYAVASTQQQADEFIRAMRAEGKPIKVKQERVPLLFASPPMMTVAFGGPITFRAVARIVLNLFAQYYPADARAPWIEPLKRFVRDGTGDATCVAFEYPVDDRAAPCPPDSFVFQHRFVLGRDHASGLVYAHVSLLGVVELAVRLGTTTVNRTETIVHDVDVTAAAMPDDVWKLSLPEVALLRPGTPTPDPTLQWRARLAVLSQKRADTLWREEAPALVRDLNMARSLPPAERHRRLVEVLTGQRQRLLNLAAYIRVALRQHLTEQLGEKAGEVADAMGVLVKGDGASKTGVTELTKAHTDMLAFVMADTLTELLADRPVTDDELRSLLEGHPGAAVIGRYMVGELQKAHPFFCEA